VDKKVEILSIDKEKCFHCGLCVTRCKLRAMTMLL